MNLIGAPDLHAGRMAFLINPARNMHKVRIAVCAVIRFVNAVARININFVQRPAARVSGQIRE